MALLTETIGNLVGRVADANADAPAVIFPELGLEWSYREFNELCERTARALLALGVRPGEHIAVWASNIPEWLLLQFGSAKMGAILVMINTNYQLTELEYILKHSDTTTLFLTSGFKDSDYIKHLNTLCPSLARSTPGELKSDNLPFLRRLVFIPRGDEDTPTGMLSWDEFLTMGSRVSPEELETVAASLSPFDVINMQYTSGTTGFPKGVMLTHSNLVNNANSIADCMRLTSKDRICLPVPFFHCFGSVLGTLACVTKGAAMVPIDHFNPVRTLEAIEKAHCTGVHGVPTMFISMLELPDFDEYDLASLRTGIMAGSPCPVSVMRQVMDRMGAKEITIAYGQTESSPVITQTRTDDPLELRVATVGRPLPGVEVKIVDPKTNETLPPGKSGELCTRGYHVMRGYYKDREATKKAIDPEGWLHTGDLGLQREDGYFEITGRLKDMIIRGGENIYPREIEEFLHTHPAVADAQVVGVPNRKYGEEVMAFVRVKPGYSVKPEKIREFMRGKVARYKIPKYVEIVEAFPMTANGKVQKFKLREVGARLVLSEAAPSVSI